MESTGLSISVIVIVVKMVEVGKEERGTKSKLTLLLPSHHSSARKIVSGKVAAFCNMSVVYKIPDKSNSELKAFTDLQYLL